MALLGFCISPPPYTVALLCFEPTSLSSVELHRDPGPLKDALPTELQRREKGGMGGLKDRATDVAGNKFTLRKRPQLDWLGLIFQISLQIVVQGVEFWSALCDEELTIRMDQWDADEEGRQSERTLQFFADRGLEVQGVI